MMYVLVLTWDMYYDGFKLPIPFNASGDDDARLIAATLINEKYCGPICVTSRLRSVHLFSLDDGRELSLAPKSQLG